MSVPAGAANPDRTATSRTVPLLIAGVIAGPLFVTTLLIQGAVRADYDPLRHPGSSLALGEYGWIQVTNFIVTGALTLAFAVGLRRLLKPHGRATWGPSLIAVWGIGLIGAGVFATDPVSGYPPGTPNMVEHPSTLGALHDVFSIPAFIALLAACLVFTRRFATQHQRGWAIYSSVTAAVFAVSFAISGVAFNQAESLVDFGGLFQRISLITGFGWLTALAIYLLNTSRPRGQLTR
ncbi:hypothetical protein Aple_018720 [Acrocarpospora pleiomorpha]|uniref:DUF998 domain-containing protein n=1 Tax=Acrocarpospora pleiomorpha TaxID=90975 RepID=A0A5M3XBB1_9ACTN|nr:DUF998 domain-containing protein [Acrocarpospora pleiomorpha]GES18977.1 hypothetical protein Aple_018720 [Acrocarpospora pleiomorpha]